MELLGRLNRQAYPAFEVVVVEQSDDPELISRIDAMADARIRVLVRPPLGAPGARNEGVRNCTGEIVLLVDDDDLPIGDDWIEKHVANYADPTVMGVVGRLCPGPDGPKFVRYPRIVRFRALKHTFFKDTSTFAWGSLRKEFVDFLIGSNVSFRRSLASRVGGWDEGVTQGEEQSFAFKFARNRSGKERFVYDPNPLVWRRVDIPGGLDRRTRPGWYRNEMELLVRYYREIVGYYFPWRYRILFPFFILRVIQQVWWWIWDTDNMARTIRQRVIATFAVPFVLPGLLLKQDRSGPVRRIDSL